MSASLRLRNGSLHIDATTFAQHLGDRESVALLRRETDLFVVPLRDSNFGGYLCKRRTAAGDRVIHAADFFREHGYDDGPERTFAADWRADVAAFVIPGFFTSDGRA